jgi:tRNA pseudouridine55 synthase
MKKILVLYKKRGETPLERLNRLREEKPEYKNEKLTYAGRLDPMAEGKLLVLVGEENKNRERYLGLDKEYLVEVLLGVATDTGDVLGKIVNNKNVGEIAYGDFRKVAKTFIEKFKQKYPKYSSKTIGGKPLWFLERGGKATDLEIPEKEVEIYDIKFVESKNIKSKILLRNIEKDISKVNGDFRQKEIVELWEKFLSKSPEVFQTFSIKVSCSSGTYMRLLAESIGKKLGSFGIAYKIKRTKIQGFK